ncbi:MAG: glycosyltransferase family 2 protein [Terrimicrobiaceae bacterium]|nr:glycosyltransferase family 2 protein [Terrimicrobiaceae bacterium]
MPVAVVVLTFNEERRLRPCLESVRWADEIVVVDGFSTDKTVEIAREFTDLVFQSDLLGPKNPGGYAGQRNFGLSKVSAPWVFFIDADERCSPELAASIQKATAAAGDGAVAYEVRRSEFFFGIHSPFTHGAGWLVRLMRKDRARWNEKLVHEGVEAEGTIERLDGDLLHFSKDTIADYLATQNRYTSLEAEELERRGDRLPAHPLFECFRTFCNIYIYKGAYREGAFGLIMSGFFASYSFQIWAKHWERELRAGRLDSSHPRFPLLEATATFLRAIWIRIRPPRE